MAKVNRKVLRGRVKFPTGGIVRDPHVTECQFLEKLRCKRLIWRNSKTDSKVWMREEGALSVYADGILRYCEW